MADAALLDRARALGITPSFFINHVVLYGVPFRDALLRSDPTTGEPLGNGLMPMRTAIDVGHEHVSLHCDTPGGPLGAMRAIKSGEFVCFAARPLAFNLRPSTESVRSKKDLRSCV